MTRKSLRLILLVLGMMAAFDATAAETAGRVLVAVGDVVAIRNGKALHLDVGATVESGDNLRTGAASNAQVRMTDGGIVALRPSTELNIDAYHFNGQQDGSEKNFVSLIKGGFRTITGLIGKTHRDNYAVKAPTATIGIRGTDYTLLICTKESQECLDVNGRQAQNGLYGSVSDGKINVANEGGNQDFSRSESFFVADANTAPKRLIAPPNFLADRLEGQERNRDRSDKEDTQLAQLSLDAAMRNGIVQVDTPVASIRNIPFVVAESTNAAGTSAVLPTQTPALLLPPPPPPPPFIFLPPPRGPMQPPPANRG